MTRESFKSGASSDDEGCLAYHDLGTLSLKRIFSQAVVLLV